MHECRDSVIYSRENNCQKTGLQAEDEDNIGDKNCYVVFQLPIKTRRRLAYPPDKDIYASYAYISMQLYTRIYMHS